ncbi:MAG: DUF3566 domain-containing protein [Candidatus Ancillula trichonymphae]|nr:DUF3566 domain-containing protein [Candidatus Ancillula trichonymphae]
MNRITKGSTENGTTKSSALRTSIKSKASSLKGRLKSEKTANLGAKSTPAPRTAGNASVAASAKSPQVFELNLRRIDPISAAKLAFFVSIALGIMFVDVVSLFWLLLDTSGVIYQFTQAMVGAGLGVKSSSGVFGLTTVALIASLLACINIVLSTIIAVVFALIYNISASLSGGIKLIFGRD